MMDGLLLLLMLEADRGRTVTVVDGLSISTKTHSLQCGASKPSESDGEREGERVRGREDQIVRYRYAAVAGDTVRYGRYLRLRWV